jgi:SAM-dependent methyltransferase
MLSLYEREYAEKLRSAFEASQTTIQLRMSPQTSARYRAPAETTVFPLEYAFHLLGDVKGKTILEYGCGDGENTVVLANRGARIIAFDISAELLALARKRVEENGCEDVELLLGSAHTLPFADESIDIVFGMAILHHLDLELASREIKRVLKPGGRGIFEEPIRNSKLIARIRKFFPQRYDVSPFERPLTDEELTEFAKPWPHRSRPFQLFLSSVANLLPFWSGRAVKLCARVDAYLLRLFPSLAYFATVKVFEMVKAANQQRSVT